MLITKEMLQTVIQQFGTADGRIAYDNAANMLTALTDPHALTYFVVFDKHENGGADIESLCHVIENGGTEGDFLDIYVQYGDTDYSEQVSVIGHNQSYYKPGNGVFLDNISSDGAGVGLDKVLNEFVAKRDMQREGIDSQEVR